MITITPDSQLAEEERLAQKVYDTYIRPTLRPDDDGKCVAVAYQSGDFEIDADDFAATERLLARQPGARIWLLRAGWATTYQIRFARAVDAGRREAR